MNYLAEASSLFEYSQQLRRDFHQHPELGFEEYRTAEIVNRELKTFGLDKIDTEFAKTGVVGLLKGDKPGPVLMLRFDMDALPITEETGAIYASQNPGVMHACGHDAHVAIGLTVAKILAAHKKELSGTVKFVFQPAEEGRGGAALMVEEGILENPKPDYILAAHVWNEKPFNWIGITPGPLMAGCERFQVVITGSGGHGASPQLTVDPVIAACHLVTALQTITSRNIAPLEHVVLSVTTIHGGTAFNIIPPKVEITGTIRTFTPEVRNTVITRFNEITERMSEAMGCTVETEIERITPAVKNDPEMTKRVYDIAAKLFPEADLVNNELTMGSEDYAYMVENIPGCYIFMGSGNKEKGWDSPHHHPHFNIDERVLMSSVALITASAYGLLSKG